MVSSSFESSRLTPVGSTATDSPLQRAFRTSDGTIIRAGIDTLSFQCEHSADFWRFAEEYAKTRKTKEYSGGAVWRGYQFTDFGFVHDFVRRQGESRCTFEFSVNKPDRPWQLLFDTQLLIPLRIKRLDFAVDYPFDMSDFHFDMKGVTRNEYRAWNGRRTVYFGAKKSVQQYRLYNKPELSVFRIESQRRRTPIEDPLPEGVFRKLKVLSMPAAGDIPWKDYAAFMTAFHEAGVQRHYTSRTARAVDALLDEYGKPLVHSPAEVYATAAPSLREELGRLFFPASLSVGDGR